MALGINYEFDERKKMESLDVKPMLVNGTCISCKEKKFVIDSINICGECIHKARKTASPETKQALKRLLNVQYGSMRTSLSSAIVAEPKPMEKTTWKPTILDISKIYPTMPIKGKCGRCTNMTINIESCSYCIKHDHVHFTDEIK